MHSSFFFSFFLISRRWKIPLRRVHDKAARTGRLLHAAVVAVGILELQTHFGSVFLEVKKLFGVEGSASLPVLGQKRKRRAKN